MKKQNKIDKRKKYYMVLDTETCPIDRERQDVTPENMLVYDIGYAIVDKKGNVYRTGSYIISDVFFKEFYSKMQSSYYAEKIPNYMQDIGENKRKVKSWSEISFILREVIQEYKVAAIVAHNARFDFGALKNTKEYLNQYAMLPFMTWYDSLKMARSVVAEMPTYKQFCQDNRYITKTGKCKLTAEVLYRFITQDNTFIESHTALEDVLIEKEILRYCFKQHKKMSRLLFS
jgi:DNA polymerase III alpha subunit (gram-positive type)